ncbi:MAG: NUDIX domain-containing protein [Anaerolineales bacterium]|nr:MAG: NUDIX domain-containing protein [Anaerolineales bacterium]
MTKGPSMQTEKRGDTFYYTAAGGVLINQAGTHVLLLFRPSRDEVRLPKGHVEKNETLEIAAIREVTEESGYVDVAIIANLGEQLVAFQYEGKQIQRTEFYFLMRTLSEQQLPRSHEDENQFFPTWVSWDEVDQNITFEAERAWLRRAYAVWNHDNRKPTA